MRYIALLLLFIAGTSEACRPRHYTVEQRFEKSEFIFIAKSIAEDSGDKIFVNYEPVEYTVEHMEIIKGTTPPNKVTLAGCGAGFANVGESSLFFVGKYNGKWHAHAITESWSAELYAESLAKVREISTNKKQNVDAKKDGAN